ncbi:MAG: alanine racemase, partial [Terriglobales bacterium]
MRANWAEISRAALRFNWMAFRRRRPRPAAGAPPLRLCAVVKANAYGHGLLECAQVFVAAGAEWLAVTDTAEALALRQGGIAARILVLGDFDREDAQEIVRHRLTPTVWTRAQADRLARAGARHRRPPGLPLAVHLKLDTGMARIGAAPAEFAALARHAAACGLAVEAAYTHLASAEGPAAGVAAQMRRLRAALAALDRRLLAPGFFWHAANSAAAWRWPAAGRPGLPGAVRQLDAAGMVRVGLGLYGSCLVPGAEAALRPVLAWKTRI